MTTLQQAIDLYLLVDRATVTNRNYTVALHAMMNYIGPSRTLSKVTYKDLVEYIAKRKDDLSQASLYQHCVLIRLFFAWCCKINYLKRSPAEGLAVRKPTETPVESLAIDYQALKGMVNRVKYTCPRDYALLMVMITTGIRIGGVVSMRLSRITLNLRDKQRGDYAEADVLQKGKKRWLTVYIVGAAYEALLAYLSVRPDTGSDQLWLSLNAPHNPLKEQGVSGRIQTLAFAEDAPRHNAHAIRHAFGHGLANAGIPLSAIQKLMGHLNERSTAIYQPRHPAYIKEIALSYADSVGLYVADEEDIIE